MSNIYIISPKNDTPLYNVEVYQSFFYLKSNDNKLFNIDDFINILQKNITSGYIKSPKSNTNLFYIFEDELNINICSPKSQNILYKLYDINSLLVNRYIYIKNKNDIILYKLDIVGYDLRLYSPQGQLLYKIQNGLFFLNHGDEADLENDDEIRGYC